MTLQTAIRSIGEFGAAQAAIAAVLCSGISVGAIVRRAWPFYRAMLRRAPELTPNDGQARYDVLDGLRGLLCLMVIVVHGAITLRLPQADGDWGQAFVLTPYALSTGGLAVSVFFAITGFLFYTRVLESGRLVSTGKFLVQRATRVGPALIASGVLIFALDTLTVRDYWPGLHPRAFAKLFTKIATLGAFGNDLIQQNAGVFWTLNYEWVFYVAFPLLGAAALGGLPVWVRLIGVYAVASLATGGLGRSGPALMFLPGIVAAHAMNVPAVRRFATRRSASALVALIAIASPAVLHGAFGFATAASVFVMFTLLCAGCEVFGVLRLPAVRAVGIASYSVYLMHGLVLFATRPLLFRLVDRPTLAWAAICAVTATAVLLSFASYRWIEHPGIELGRRLTRRKDA